MDKATEKMLQRLSDRLAALLKSDPDWKETAELIEESLDNAGLQVEAAKDSPQAFARNLFQDNPKLSVLAETALRNKMDVYQIDQPLDLVNYLLPSDHHLD